LIGSDRRCGFDGGFHVGAEVVLSKYSAAGSDATLMLIEYPTPQIAAEQAAAD